MRFAIIGFGSAGATTAILLARQGHEIHLYERAPENQPVGAGFLLQPSGMKVLKDLNILLELLPHTARVEKLYCRNLAGKTMLDLPYADLEPSLFGAGTHRGTFLTILEKHTLAAGVNIHWNTPIRSYTQNKNVTLTDESNTTHPNFDAIIIADGARSTLRTQLNIPQTDKKYPWGALWFIGNRTPEFSPNTLWQAVHSTSLLNGYLPTGTRDDLLSLFWSIRIDQIEKWRATPLDQWKSEVLKLTPHAETYLDQITSHQQLKTAQYHDVVMPHWHDRKAIIIGDAAHALSPQLGQGVNLALLDAQHLATHIANQPLETAFQQYSKTRNKHLKFYQFATRWTTPFFQSDHHTLANIRDRAFPIANKIPYLRRQMTATMAGLKTGPFSSLPLHHHLKLDSQEK